MNVLVRDRIRALISRTGETVPVIAAIDGGCCSGKSFLAREIFAEFDCNVFHCDHFFLRPEQKTPQRLIETGGNMDRERLLKEVILPVKASSSVTYRAYSCQTLSFLPEIKISPKRLSIIEGAYSLHPELSAFYDLRIFLKAPFDIRLERLKNREGRGPDALDAFIDKWIPAEDKYFAEFDIEGKADIVAGL